MHDSSLIRNIPVFKSEGLIAAVFEGLDINGDGTITDVFTTSDRLGLLTCAISRHESTANLAKSVTARDGFRT